MEKRTTFFFKFAIFLKTMNALGSRAIDMSENPGDIHARSPPSAHYDTGTANNQSLFFPLLLNKIEIPWSYPGKLTKWLVQRCKFKVRHVYVCTYFLAICESITSWFIVGAANYSLLGTDFQYRDNLLILCDKISTLKTIWVYFFETSVLNAYQILDWCLIYWSCCWCSWWYRGTSTLSRDNTLNLKGTPKAGSLS